MVRGILAAQAGLERTAQGDGDTELMRLCCVQLFNVGALDDVREIWLAKESSFDAHSAIDVQLLCGAGLEPTKAYLAGDSAPWAADALAYLLRCEAAEDFADFDVEDRSAEYDRYYR